MINGKKADQVTLNPSDKTQEATVPVSPMPKQASLLTLTVRSH